MGVFLLITIFVLIVFVIFSRQRPDEKKSDLYDNLVRLGFGRLGSLTVKLRDGSVGSDDDDLDFSEKQVDNLELLTGIAYTWRR